jgi:hypothetical protein
MPSVIEYTDKKNPLNDFPRRIISPTHSSPCCFTDMEEVGEPQTEGRWVFRHKRCRRCGFAVRVILRELPDLKIVAQLRRILDIAERPGHDEELPNGYFGPPTT